MSPADGASRGSRENIMGDQPIQLTVCPSCGADLLAEQSRDPLPLKDVDEEVEVQNGSLIQQAEVRYKQLLAWRCLTCSAVVPAYEPTSPIRELTGLRPSPTSHAVVTSGVGTPVGQDDP